MPRSKGNQHLVGYMIGIAVGLFIVYAIVWVAIPNLIHSYEVARDYWAS